MRKATVKIYTTPTCKYCVQVKEWLKSRDIPFVEVDVQGNPLVRREMIDLTEQMGVPVTAIDGVGFVIGFDEAKLEELCQKKY